MPTNTNGEFVLASGTRVPATVSVGVDGEPVSAAQGALDDDPVTDPEAASASTNGLLRGILTELQAQTALLQTIATNTAV